MSTHDCSPIVGTAVHVLDTIAEILGDNVDEVINYSNSRCATPFQLLGMIGENYQWQGK